MASPTQVLQEHCPAAGIHMLGQPQTFARQSNNRLLMLAATYKSAATGQLAGSSCCKCHRHSVRDVFIGQRAIVSIWLTSRSPHQPRAMQGSAPRVQRSSSRCRHAAYGDLQYRQRRRSSCAASGNKALLAGKHRPQLNPACISATGLHGLQPRQTRSSAAGAG